MRRRSWVLGVVTSASALLAGCVEGFFFHPDQLTYTTPAQLGLVAHDVFFQSADGVRLHGWWLPAAGIAHATVVHAHGNAANISNHLPLVAWLPREGINVLSFDYRGFGRSEGKPTLDGVVADTRAALAEARRRRTAPNQPLVLLGQSLGGATAIRAAAEETSAGASDIKLLVIDSAFASYRGIVREAASGSVLGLIAPLAVASLPPATSDPLAALGRIGLPLLFLHGDQDRVISIRNSEQLHAAAVGPKHFVRIAGGQHIDALTREEVRARVLAMIASASRGSP